MAESPRIVLYEKFVRIIETAGSKRSLGLSENQVLLVSGFLTEHCSLKKKTVENVVGRRKKSPDLLVRYCPPSQTEEGECWIAL